MKVKELIALLQTMPQELDVAYCAHSEFALLEPDDIEVAKACVPRPDGWIQRYRVDKEVQDYLMFPGR